MFYLLYQKEQGGYSVNWYSLALLDNTIKSSAQIKDYNSFPEIFRPHADPPFMNCMIWSKESSLSKLRFLA